WATNEARGGATARRTDKVNHRHGSAPEPMSWLNATLRCNGAQYVARRWNCQVPRVHASCPRCRAGVTPCKVFSYTFFRRSLIGTRRRTALLFVAVIPSFT